MAIRIGIDAGGTYTDAVVYSLEDRVILGGAKALTTKEDLSIGIGKVLDHFDPALLRQAAGVSLSTTLATNACVEEKGGNGKLVFIDVDLKVVNWVGGSYGLPAAEDLRLLTREEARHPALFFRENEAWLRDSDGVAVVDLHAKDNQAALEKCLGEEIRQRTGLPVICGHELFNELNSIRRGASTLLNVRLIPVIAEFLEAIRSTLTDRGIGAPISIVRSDGTLMSEGFTQFRPVETLLCGPAAGLAGVAHLADEADSLVVDMGGTTTDISVIQNHRPEMTHGGVNIGKWRTFVRGIFVDTFGLGGDSSVLVDKAGALSLGARRSIPFCMAAARWPGIKTKLEALLASKERHTRPLHEFFVLAKDIAASPRYTDREKAFCRGLAKGPASYSEAAALWGSDVYNLNVDRLESEGIVQRCGLTPTDIMHLKGDFTSHDGEASRLGARFVAGCAGLAEEELADTVYELVKKKLYRNIVRILLQRQYPSLRENPLSPELELLLEESWAMARDGMTGPFLGVSFQAPAKLVGIGAPIHIFLPDVAKALSAGCLVPEGAGVANALGAAVARVQAVYRVEVKPVQGDTGDSFLAAGPYESFLDEDREAAVENAREQAIRAAREEAVRRGITAALQIDTLVSHSVSPTRYGGEVYLGSTVEATAYNAG